MSNAIAHLPRANYADFLDRVRHGVSPTPTVFEF